MSSLLSRFSYFKHKEWRRFFVISFAGVQDADLSVLSQTMAQCCKNIKETVQMLASRHKDIHGSVSKVGKAIDRVSTYTCAQWKIHVMRHLYISDMRFAELWCRNQCCGGRKRVGHPRKTEIPERDYRGASVSTRDAQCGWGSLSGQLLQIQEVSFGVYLWWLLPEMKMTESC